MASVLAAIGSWIAGVAVPAITQFIIEGVAIVASFISSPFLLAIGFAIAVITTAVILYYKGFFNSVKKDYKEVQILEEKKIFDELDQHKEEAAHIGLNLTFFEKNLNEEILNYINKENIKNEEKKSTLRVFIGYVLSLVTNAKKNGENNNKKNLDLYESGVATLIYKYDKNNGKINLNFVFYDDKIFLYLKFLIKMLKEKGYELENKNYENEINNFIVEDAINQFKIILKNI